MSNFEIAVLIATVGGLVCAVIAGSKKRNPFFYMLLGMLVPLIGVVVTLYAKPRT